jgi:hypothetical protein
MPLDRFWVVGAHSKQKVNRQLQRDVSVTLGLIPCIQHQHTLAQMHARRVCNGRFSLFPAFIGNYCPRHVRATRQGSYLHAHDQNGLRCCLRWL